MRDHLEKYLKFMKIAENLKFELRHSWLSNGRRESVAEHSWRLALMVMTISPYLDQPIDVEKSLKIALIHDLCEAIVGDLPNWGHLSALEKSQKYERELAAILHIKRLLADAVGEEIHDLWIEFEHQQSYEAKVVCALDKLECQIQHLEADLSTWNEIEIQNDYAWLDKHCDFDSALKSLKEHVKEKGFAKLNAECLL